MICRCGECARLHRKRCPLACPHCARDLLDGACHYASDHPDGQVYVKVKVAQSRFRDDPLRQCQGKRGYQKKATAKLVIRRGRHFVDRSNVRVYRCPHCGLWHIGHKPGTQPPAEAA